MHQLPAQGSIGPPDAWRPHFVKWIHRKTLRQANDSRTAGTMEQTATQPYAPPVIVVPKVVYVSRSRGGRALLKAANDFVQSPNHGAQPLTFKRQSSTLNSRRALISKQDARRINQVLFIAKPLNQFVGEWTDFALQIRGKLAIDFSPCVRR